MLDTATKLEAVPATAEAFAAGQVSAAAAREIAGAVAVDPAAEAALLAVAAGGDHRGLVDAAAAVRQAARSVEDEAARHARLRAKRYARTRTDADGLVVLHAGFAPKDWAPFASLWQRATDTEFTKARRHGRRDTPDAYAADALLALLATGTTQPANQRFRRSSATDPRTEARCSTAVDHTADPSRRPAPRATGRPTSAGPPARPAAAGVKAEIVVLVDGIALKRGHVSSGERCEIVGVGPVDITWVKQLLPTAIVHALIHNGVDITTYASATRAIRKAVRLAVTTRDRTCVVAGCHQQRHLQQDHRHDYAHGGTGSTDNLNLLCQYHHNQKTRDGARLERIDDHWHWHPPGHTTAWISPVGATLTLWDTDTS